jgi:hypothetical protein
MKLKLNIQYLPKADLNYTSSVIRVASLTREDNIATGSLYLFPSFPKSSSSYRSDSSS